MTTEENMTNDNTWKHIAIFAICWFLFWGLCLPIIDYYVLDRAYGNFLCDNGLVFPIMDYEEFCSK